VRNRRWWTGRELVDDCVSSFGQIAVRELPLNDADRGRVGVWELRALRLWEVTGTLDIRSGSSLTGELAA
jgi:hypothetical protein